MFRAWCVVAIGLSVGLGTAAAAPAAGDPADVIRRIYRDHRPWNRVRIELDHPEVAARYFDPPLAALLRKDFEEAERRQDMGCLDFDPFLQAQDFDEKGITEPRLRELKRSDGVAYEVTFTGRSEAWKKWNVRAVYVLSKTPPAGACRTSSSRRGARSRRRSPAGIAPRPRPRASEGSSRESCTR